MADAATGCHHKNEAAWWDRFHTILQSQLSGKHKLAMLVIAGYAGDGNECWASMDTIADALSVVPDVARKTVKELDDAGFLERLRRQHSASLLHVRWERFGTHSQQTKSSIDEIVDRRFRRSQPTNAPVDTTYKNTPKNTPSNTGGVSRFVPPSVEDVAAYCRERSNTIDPEQFVDHYTANGWRCGRTAMKDWRAAVRNWERNAKTWGTPTGGTLFDLGEFNARGAHDPA